VLRVECGRCQRKGRYSVRRLIEKYGRQANMMKWKEQLNGDCPKSGTRRSLIKETEKVLAEKRAKEKAEK
jgi:hypothetical protein